MAKPVRLALLGFAFCFAACASPAVTPIAFRPDGEAFISASGDGALRVWDTNGVELQSLAGHTDTVNSLSFSGDGNLILSCSADKTMKIWDAHSGQLIKTLFTDSAALGVFDPSGDRIFALRLFSEISILDRKSGEDLGRLNAPSLTLLFALAVSPGADQLAAGSFQGSILRWSISKGFPMLPSLAGHTDRISAIAFSPNGRLLASGSADKTIKIWDTASGKELKTLGGHTDAVSSVAFSPDSARVLSASHDKTIKVWDVSSGREQLGLRGHFDKIFSAVFSPDGGRIVSSSGDKTIRIWDAQNGQELKTLYVPVD